MAKKEGPWVRFFPSDWLAGTRGMSAAETGIYITLIMIMYERGEPVPRDDARQARLCGSPLVNYRRVLETLIDLGKIDLIDGDKIWQKKVSLELRNRIEKSASARNSSNERWRGKGRKNNDDDDANAMRSDAERIPKKDATRARVTTTTRIDSSLRSESNARWEEFWSLYPHKVGKADAAKAFKRACNRVDHQTMMDGLQRYAAKTDDRPWCNPSTWLNQDRWGDQPAQQPQRNGYRQQDRPPSAFELSMQLEKDFENADRDRQQIGAGASRQLAAPVTERDGPD